MKNSCLYCGKLIEDGKFCSKQHLDAFYDKKRKRVYISLNEAEFDRLEAKAKAYNMKTATYAKKLVLDPKKTVKMPSPDYLKIFGQLGKIGNNFNQIAHKLNVLEKDNRISKIDAESFRNWLNYHYEELSAINEELIKFDG